MRAVSVCLLVLASCSARTPDYASQANEIGEVGQVPQSVKLAAAQILDRCEVPINGRYIFWHWEGPANQPPYTLELTGEQFENESLKACLKTQTNSLGLSSQLDVGAELPPPPPGWIPKESYLLIAAERHVDDPAGVPPIPNARALLPKALKNCGIDEFHEREITDGIFALEFAVLPKNRTDRISCIQREQPRGAWVEPAD